jgi:hypothetical protein
MLKDAVVLPAPLQPPIMYSACSKLENFPSIANIELLSTLEKRLSQSFIIHSNFLYQNHYTYIFNPMDFGVFLHLDFIMYIQ